jgi:hypothetical protein
VACNSEGERRGRSLTIRGISAPAAAAAVMADMRLSKMERYPLSRRLGLVFRRWENHDAGDYADATFPQVSLGLVTIKLQAMKLVRASYNRQGRWLGLELVK